MKKYVIIGVAVLVLGGGAAFLLIKKDDKSATDNQATTQSATGGQSSTSSDFSPVSTEGLDFVATVTTTSKTGTSTAKLEQDGEKTRYTISANGADSQFIYTKSAYYTCTGGECFKYPASQSSTSGVDVSSFSYTSKELTDFKGTSAYKGKKDCPAGSCDVWEVSAGGAKTSLYLDASNKRISQVESTVGDTSTKISYSYEDVTISEPKNAKTLPTTP